MITTARRHKASRHSRSGGHRRGAHRGVKESRGVIDWREVQYAAGAAAALINVRPAEGYRASEAARQPVGGI
jgi:hypothetical protein